MFLNFWNNGDLEKLEICIGKYQIAYIPYNELPFISRSQLRNHQFPPHPNVPNPSPTTNPLNSQCPSSLQYNELPSHVTQRGVPQLPPPSNRDLFVWNKIYLCAIFAGRFAPNRLRVTWDFQLGLNGSTGRAFARWKSRSYCLGGCCTAFRVLVFRLTFSWDWVSIFGG